MDTSYQKIRNERTPKGDGNLIEKVKLNTLMAQIRNERTPKGDGNSIKVITRKIFRAVFNKK